MKPPGCSPPTARAKIAFSLLLALGLAAPARSGPAPREAFYVSPTGKDANDGRGPGAPFQTLERARDAMRGSTIKTVILLDGTYMRTRSLVLTGQDSGERWLSGLNGEHAVLSAGDNTLDAITISARDVVISGLTLSHYARNGIFIQNSAQIKIEGNTIEDLRSTGQAQAAINAENKNDDVSITGNRISGTNYSGIAVQNDDKTPFDHIYIAGNTVSGTCRTVSDCGAIYVDDRSHSAKDVRIEGNVISDIGRRINARGIYLDDYASNVVVKCNRITGPGDFAFAIHGGDHNDISRNLVDMANIDILVLYQQEPARAGNFGMAENRFHDNWVGVEPERRDMLFRTSLTAPNQPLAVANSQFATSAKARAAAVRAFEAACRPT